MPVSQPVRIRICFMLFNELLLVENTPSSYMYLGRVRGRGGEGSLSLVSSTDSNMCMDRLHHCDDTRRNSHRKHETNRRDPRVSSSSAALDRWLGTR